MMRRSFVAALVLLVGSHSSAVRAADDVITPHKLAKLRFVTQTQISPDAQQVAYVLSVPRDPFKGSDGRAYSELHVVDAAGNSRPFVTGKTNIRSISWSSDGKEIRFLAKRGDDKGTCLYSISSSGGEARKILSHDTSISGYSFHSDGNQVAFLATEPENAEIKKLKEKGFNQQVYEEDNPFVRVWITTLDGSKKVRKLELKGNASTLHWSPKGDLLSVALARTPLIDDAIMMRRVHLVNATTGAVVANLNNPGKLGETEWSPDGKHLAVVSGENINDPSEGRLWLYNARGQKLKDLLPDYPGHVANLAWRDNVNLVYVADRDVHAVVGEINVRTGRKSVWIPAGKSVVHGLSLADNGRVGASVGESASHPGEVVLVTSNGKPRRLTNSNEWLDKVKLAKQEVVRYQARDGLEIQGILVHPLNAKAGKRYPLILAVHGGPESHIRDGWVTYYSRPGQVAAAQGFAVFYPNYRGSTGRGVRFSRMGQADAAGKEFDDFVDGVDHLIKQGLVDKDRVGITGGSYGGYASAWAATRYTKRFAASVMFVGISDNVSKVGTTDIPYEMFHVHHRKFLWDDWKYFLERSPIYYVEQARTPLLIMHGKEDPRVHPSQSLELYRHFKVLGKAPVRLVFYPGEGHGNRRAASRLDYNLRMLRWMTHYLKGPGGKPPAKDLKYDE